MAYEIRRRVRAGRLVNPLMIEFWNAEPISGLHQRRLPREVETEGSVVLTSIFKAPVSGPVGVRQVNLDGDRQSDLSVHGGAHKAVYVYPSEHYAFWRGELPSAELPWGAFGENVTTEGVREDTTYVGDRFRIGSAGSW